MKKRLVALTMASVMLLGLFAGCADNGGSNNSTPATTAPATSAPAATSAATSAPTEPEVSPYGDTGGLKLPISEDVIDITWMTSHDNVDWVDSPLVKELQKRTNLHLVIENVPVDSVNEKINTQLASRNLPNLMNAGTARGNLYGEQGAFLAFNDYYDLIPNFKSTIVDNPENDWYIKTYSTEAGNIYTWPYMDLQRKVNHMYMYRKDIFDKNNLTVWEAGDSEGFYQTLKKLKEIYPDSLPFGSKMASNIWYYHGAGWGMPQNSWPMNYNHESGEWSYNMTSPEIKEMADYFKKLYDEKLIDPEFLTDTSASWVAKMAAPETMFVTFDWISRLDIFYDQVHAEQPDYLLEAAPPVGPTGKHYKLPTLANLGVTVSAITEHSTEALQLLDYLFSPSGATLNTIGVEGEWFNFDENGVPVYTDAELAAKPKIEINDLATKYGLWNQSMYVRVDRRSLYHKLTEKEQYANDIITEKDLFLPDNPLLPFSDEIAEDNNQIATDLNTKGYEALMKYVIDPSFGEAGWQAWLDNAKVIGVDKLVENYNAAQAVYDAK